MTVSTKKKSATKKSTAPKKETAASKKAAQKKKAVAPKVSDRERRAKAGITLREEQGGKPERMSDAAAKRHYAAQALVGKDCVVTIDKKKVTKDRKEMRVLRCVQKGQKIGLNKPLVRDAMKSLFGVESESNIATSSRALREAGFVTYGTDATVGKGKVTKVTDAGAKVNTSGV